MSKKDRWEKISTAAVSFQHLPQVAIIHAKKLHQLNHSTTSTKNIEVTVGGAAFDGYLAFSQTNVGLMILTVVLLVTLTLPTQTPEIPEAIITS